MNANDAKPEEASPDAAQPEGAAPGSIDAAPEPETASAAPEPAPETAESPGEADAPEPDADRLAAEAARIRALFAAEGDSGPDFRLARWTRPIRLAVYGAEPESAETVAAALAEAAAVAGAALADPETEGEAEPNLLVYLCDAWSALGAAPGLSALEPDLERLLAGLEASGANAHRFFKISRSEGIVFAVVLLRVDATLAAVSGQAAALGQTARALALFCEDALAAESPLVLRRSGRAAFKGWFARLLGALYAEDAPAFTEDADYAQRLAAAITAPAKPAKPAKPVSEESDGRRKRKRRRRRDEPEDAKPEDAKSEDAGTEETEPETVGAAAQSDDAQTEQAAPETAPAEPSPAADDDAETPRATDEAQP